jgi:hypothetical protein
MTLSLIHPIKPHKNYGNSIIIFAGFAVATSALVMQGCALWLIFPDVDYSPGAFNAPRLLFARPGAGTNNIFWWIAHAAMSAYRPAKPVF